MFIGMIYRIIPIPHDASSCHSHHHRIWNRIEHMVGNILFETIPSPDPNDRSDDRIWLMDKLDIWWFKMAQIHYDLYGKYGMEYHDDPTQPPTHSLHK